MNAHTPFDANQDWTNPYCRNSSNDPMVDALLGNAYHVVRTVYCNLGNLKLIYDFLNKYGMVLGVQSETELKAMPTSASYVRLYGFDNTLKRVVTDYLYVEGDRTGVIPDDPSATGSWILVATSNSDSGEDDGEGKATPPYIPYSYNNGSAIGGETSIPVPAGTVGVPMTVINGYTNLVGYGFTYDASSLTVTLSQPLEPGDEVHLFLTGTPAVPDNPNVSDWVQINWLYNGGYASGGEQVIAIPYTFESVPAIYKNGERYYAGLANKSYAVDASNQRILLTEPLATNDRLIVTIGGESETLIMSDRTIQEVARSANVKDTEIILSTNTTQYLNDKKVIYDVVAQKIYGLPTLPTNVYINSVSNGQLTYSPGNITVDLNPVPGPGIDAANTLRADLASRDLELGDNLLTVKQPFTGSVARTQHSKNTDHVSIKDFGAVGDGVTDDTAAIKAAFAYAATKGKGCTIDIPDGTYLLKEEIVADGDNVQIYLNSVNSGGCSFVWSADSTSQGLRLGTVTPISRFSIYGLTFVTHKVTTAPAVTAVFDRSAPKSLIFQDVSAYGGAVGGTAADGYWGGGLCRAKDPVYPIYEHCYFFGIGGPEAVDKSNLIPSGFLIESTNGVFFNNFRNCFVNNVNNAIWFRTLSTPGIEGSFIESCNFNGVNTGVRYEGYDSGNNGYFPPQLFINNSQIEYLQRAVSVHKAGKVSIRGNLFYADPLNDVALTHVLLEDVESAIITDNYMETRPVHTQCDGVYVAGASQNIQVYNNHIKIPTGKYAVVFGGSSSNCSQSNNLVLGGKEYANTSTNKATNTAENYVINGERSTVLPDGSIMKSGSRVVTLGANGSFTVDWVSPFPNGINTCLPHNGDSDASTGAVTPTVFNVTGMTGVVAGGTSGSSARINYMAVGF